MQQNRISSSPAPPLYFRKSFYVFSAGFEILCYSAGFLVGTDPNHMALIMALCFLEGLLLVEALAVPALFENPERLSRRYLTRICLGMTAILAALWFMPDHGIQYTLLVTSLLYLQFNQMLRLQVLDYLNLAFLVAGFSIFIINDAARSPSGVGYLDKVNLLGYALLTGASILNLLCQRSFVLYMKNSLHHAKVREASEKNLVFFQQFSSKLVAHDVNNALMMVNRASELARQGNESTSRIPEILESVVERISGAMTTLDLNNRKDVPLIQVLNRARKDFRKIEFELSNDLRFISLHLNENLFSGIFYNIFSNAWEAHQRRSLNRPLRIKIDFDLPNRVLHITDNAGGFDIAGIGQGRSEKVDAGFEHGVFLRAITDPQIADLLMLEVRVERTQLGTESGTRVNLRFLPKA